MKPKDLVGRRDFLKTTFYAGTIMALSGAGLQKVLAATGGTINFADMETRAETGPNLPPKPAGRLTLWRSATRLPPY